MLIIGPPSNTLTCELAWVHTCARSDLFFFFVFSDSSGTITFDEFKNVFKANIGPNAIPFDFDWYVV